jgi:hypothetical protein
MNYKSIGYAVMIAATATAFVIGSAVPSDAKGKKKEAAAPAPTPITCLGLVRAPVCASKGDMKFTYANACYAAKDGAKSAKAGECKPAKAAKKSKGKKAAKKKG